MSDFNPTPIPTHVQRAIAKGRRAAKRKAHSLHRPCSVAGVESEVCGDCEGKGVVLKTNGWMLFDGKCKRCSGTGRIEPTKPLNAADQRPAAKTP